MSDVDTDKIACRILGALAPYHQDEIERRVALLLKPKACESPIEAMLGVAIVEYERIFDGRKPVIISSVYTIGLYHKDARLLVYQQAFENYCIDWVLRVPPFQVFIECDGHDFHERTKEQAAHDRRRDRLIQQADIPILRFTGSEIFKDPIFCASQVWEFVGELFARDHQRKTAG